jgi:hypothetical protein
MIVKGGDYGAAYVYASTWPPTAVDDYFHVQKSPPSIEHTKLHAFTSDI